MRGRHGRQFAGLMVSCADESGRFGKAPHLYSTIPPTGLCFWVCLLAIFLGPCARAQSTDEVHVVPRSGANDDPGQNSTANRLRLDVDLVLVPTTVTDRTNRPIVDLEKQDFGIYEDDRPQQIRYFGEEDAPISVGLVLDVSRSMTNKIDTERRAVAEFFKRQSAR
jgi:hypothetical protein